MSKGEKKVAALAAAVCFIAPFAAHADVNVVELPVTSIESGLSSGTFTDGQLVQSYLDRISIYNPTYNAFTYLNPDALNEAIADDAIIAGSGVPANKPLFGVPIVVKDSMNVAGVRTTGGYSGFTAENGGADMIPLADAPIVARLRAAGAIILGKTNLPAFAKSAANANTSYLGPTLNSYNKGIIPGGSSSGTATAVSASFAAIGTAEETGGSIENPAGAQSLIGVKTTFGLVPTSGGFPLDGSTRNVFGVNARNVTDAANFLSVIAGPDASDPNTAASAGHVPAAGYTRPAGLSTTSLAGKRIGLWSPDFKNVTLSTETQDLYNADVAKLTALGATVVSNVFADPTLAHPFTYYASEPITSSAGTFSFSAYSGVNEPYDLSQWMATLDPSKSPTTVAAFQAKTGINLLAPSGSGGPILGGNLSTTPNLANAVLTPDVSQTDMVAAFMQGRADMLAAFRQVMADNNLDALFFPQEYKEPGALVGGSYANTTVSEVNLMGTPLVDLPGGYYADGSPFSVAFLGDQWTESTLLDYAYGFEQGTDFRVAPTLSVPEPGSLAVLSCVSLALLRRRHR